jgi:Domain of unknown function (DUF4160)
VSKLKRFPGCRIVIYPRDHRPPHVHVEFRDGDRCKVEIETLLVTGTVRPSGKLAKPLAWIAANRKWLLAKWQEIVR